VVNRTWGEEGELQLRERHDGRDFDEG